VTRVKSLSESIYLLLKKIKKFKKIGADTWHILNTVTNGMNIIVTYFQKYRPN